MAGFVVSYDLPDGSNYELLYNALKSYPGWARVTASTWMVAHPTGSASAIRDHLQAFVPPGGRLFVVRSAAEAAWKNVFCSNAWLEGHLV